MLKICSIGSFPVIRTLHSTTLLKLISKDPLKEPRKLTAERVKRVKKVSTLCLGLEQTAAGIRMLEDIVSNEQRITRPRQKDKRTTAD